MKDVVAINTIGFKCPVTGEVVQRDAKSVVTISDEDYAFFKAEGAVDDVTPEATIIANSKNLNFLKDHAPAAPAKSEKPAGKGGKSAKAADTADEDDI